MRRTGESEASVVAPEELKELIKDDFKKALTQYGGENPFMSKQELTRIKQIMERSQLMKEKESAKAVRFWLAIKDAHGYPTEFISLQRIKEKYGEAGINDLPGNPSFFLQMMPR